ncbi:diguanylate cyclase [Desulfonatronovibrio magnus]|uniref:diguanylate cyclase n=1 Tax=Desulfonatronovibrio magnus TaxID=698827 RepID=UPI0005EAE93A|nr:diguanylate cyclase [Desulfonatronovibrio magnus]
MNITPLDLHDKNREVLIVEDSNFLSYILQNAVREHLKIEPVMCTGLREAAKVLENRAHTFFAALLDLHLPDAPNGEVVDLVVGYEIPSVVFTATLSDKLRERMWSKKIVDYVLKENQENVVQVMETIKRLQKNMGMKVLVADDSNTSRKIVRNLLEVWNFTVLEAVDGQDALAKLKQEPDISMLITDYNMPKLNGVDLVKEIRRSHSKSRLPVIGLSGVGDATTSAYFLKAGANDYMHKPFIAEELYCRVRHNIETTEYIKTIRNMAEKDFLTGLYNRRYFFGIADKMFERARRDNKGLVIAMMDIDHFKKCNDQFGHDAGDEVIRFVGRTILSCVRESDLVARFGGEEYCVACAGMDGAGVKRVFEKIRSSIESTVIHFDKHDIKVTVSIGVCPVLQDSLEEMITASDKMLYEAKAQGRNQIQVLA